MKVSSAITRWRAAFSLVEVVLALGLVSFCLLSIVGLLPVGLQSIKNAREEAAAANALNQLAEALRNATNVGGSTAYAAVGFPGITWSLGGPSNSFTNSLSVNGQPTSSTDSRFVARVELVPPADPTVACHARVSIAWPATAVWTGGAWTKSDGSVGSGMQFLLKQ